MACGLRGLATKTPALLSGSPRIRLISSNPRTQRADTMTRRRQAAGSDGGAAAAAAAAQAVAALLQRHEEGGTLPRCVVFDLDYTLWPFWCEMMSPSHQPWLYPHVPAILDGLEEKGVQLAVASRTPTPRTAAAFLDKLSLRDRFNSIQLIPAADGFDSTTAQKDTAHLPRIQAELGVPYDEMLFFDDEHGNIRKVSRLGVTSILVDTSAGVDVAALEKGLAAHAAAQQQRAAAAAAAQQQQRRGAA